MLVELELDETGLETDANENANENANGNGNGNGGGEEEEVDAEEQALATDYASEGGVGTGELRLGASWTRTLGSGSWSARYGGVIQGWGSGYALDGHVAELAAWTPGTVAPGGVTQLRGSAISGWTELLLAPALRLEAGDRARIWLRAGPALRGAPDVSGFGVLAGTTAVWELTPRVGLQATADARRFMTDALPTLTADADAGVRWWPRPKTGGLVAVGVTDVSGDTELWTAGLPPADTTWLRSRVQVEHRFTSWLSVGAETSLDAGPDGYQRVRALVGISGRLGRVEARGGPISTPGSARFHFWAPQATSVEVTGSFCAWEPMALTPTESGEWSLELELEPGAYEYVYLVDGNPVVPPEARMRRDDGFGGENGVLVVE